MRKAYMVDNRIFFDAGELSDYLLARVDRWKQLGCVGELRFPQIMLGTYSIQSNSFGQPAGIFTENKSGRVFNYQAIS